jgi:hypothetical protein
MWNSVVNIIIANVGKIKVTIITNQFSSSCQGEFSQWRMDIEKVCTLEVMTKELSEMNLIKAVSKEVQSVTWEIIYSCFTLMYLHYFGWKTDEDQSHGQGKCCDGNQSHLIARTTNLYAFHVLSIYVCL